MTTPSQAIGLVGCGKWGKNILRDLVTLGARVYVADPDEAARVIACRSGASAAYADLAEFPPCDGYIVAVPIPGLADRCMELLRYRKPIFCEKTLITALPDYERLAENGGDDRIFCMHKWAYHPGILQLQGLVESGAVGALREIHITRTTWTRDYHGADLILCHCIHSLTIVKTLLGYIPERIPHLSVLRDSDGVIDSMVAVLRQSGIEVLIQESGRSAQKRSSIELFGTDGTAVLKDPLDASIIVKNRTGEKEMPIDTTMPLYLELQEFLRYLNGGPPPRFPLAEGLAMAKALWKLYESIEEGNEQSDENQ